MERLSSVMHLGGWLSISVQHGIENQSASVQKGKTK